MVDGTAESESSFAWLRTPVVQQGWNSAEIQWLEMRPLQEARRDVPRIWSFRLDAPELVGEVEAIGSDALLGPERAGRRAVEIRFSVAGWLEIDGERWPVMGMIRHAQQ